MGWQLPRYERRTYPRNPLEAVIVQLRFDPILKIRDQVAEFQDGVRHRFPKFEEQITQSFEINPIAGVRTRQEPELRFRTTDASGTVFLSTHAVAMESRAHIERDALLEDFGIVLKALRATYDPISPLRLGLRYLNILDRRRIQEDLGIEVSWSDLVAEDFIRVPCGLAELTGMAFGAELTGEIDGGRMTLRYGMVQEEHGDRFRLDIDRFDEAEIEMDAVPDLLAAYAGDIYSVFRSAARPRLLEWMERGDSDG